MAENHEKDKRVLIKHSNEVRLEHTDIIESEQQTNSELEKSKEHICSPCPGITCEGDITSLEWPLIGQRVLVMNISLALFVWGLSEGEGILMNSLHLVGGHMVLTTYMLSASLICSWGSHERNRHSRVRVTALLPFYSFSKLFL